MGHGVGYRSPHDDAEGVIAQQYLPDGLEDVVLFEPGRHGDEASVAERQLGADDILGKPGRGGRDSGEGRIGVPGRR